jgi:ATP-dependent helicase/nuclease subunit B
MQARFLLGPAGSGKTFRCLAEVRAELQKNSDGEPLIFLAPKQATFQIERQLLADEKLSGFTRLQILSFDRLAQFVFEKLQIAPPKLLSGEGRVMVLRALLLKHENELKLFRGSARRTGFATELAKLLAELQQQQFSPAKLRALAANEKLRRELRAKLHDLALLAENYSGWLHERDLQDADCLLDFATAELKKSFSTQNSKLKIQNLWLDGFAEMTPQELALLAAIIPFCDDATLAFCLETEPAKTESWLSIWSAIGKTFHNCRQQIANVDGVKIQTEILRRDSSRSRFAVDSDLAALEESWTLQTSQPATSNQQPATVSVTACANPEAEAVFAARAILQFVRAGNRFRDCAVLVRNLENYHRPLARIFRRYEIPFFIDRRESVAHHPLAELTRSALRTVAFDWRNEDWFAALKAGFSPVAETEIDALENAALASGWRGKKWREPLDDQIFDGLLTKIIPPYEKFFTQLAQTNFSPSGAQLAEFIWELWANLKVEQRLELWSKEISEAAFGKFNASTHSSVWEQMNSWLDNVARGFPHEQMGLRDWLPVLEAGLSNLTVGAIPPALDEVLVGAIDRARNPALKFALVLGVNESVFPAAPPTPAILTNADRDELENQKASLGANVLDQISRERYLGYIACTRAGEKLSLAFSRQSADGKTFNPSPLIAQVQKILPAVQIEEFANELNCENAEHANELIPLLLQKNRLPEIPALQALGEKLSALREPNAKENLSREMAEKLYAPVLKTSVSRLEEFAACPFKFFVKSGLRANERKVFELDARERGNFQHEVLKKFHEQLQSENKRWRDIEPLEARARIKKIADAAMENFGQGILRDSAETLFAARTMTSSLQDFIEVIVGWLRGQYEFDPAKVEFDFGSKESPETAWQIDLGDGKKLSLQGRIDRVDLCRNPENNSALAVVIDYKSGGKKLEPLLVENGIQLQLLAYLGALRRWKNPRGFFGAEKIIPAGAFYVSLRGKFEGGGSREEILADTEAKKNAYRQSGRFDAGWLKKFDRRDIVTGDQFKFKLNKGGDLSSKLSDGLPCKEFAGLLDQVEEQLRGIGEKILSGAAQVDPFRKGKETPCEFCDYRAACRLDEWTHEFRELRNTKPLADETI